MARNVNALMTDSGKNSTQMHYLSGAISSSKPSTSGIKTPSKPTTGAASNLASRISSTVNSVRSQPVKTPFSSPSSSSNKNNSGGSSGGSGSGSYGSSGYRSGSGSSGGGGGSASSGPTDAEKKAAANQTAIAKQNVRDVQAQLARQLANYDLADSQNKALWQTQLKQNSRKTSEDRFEAQRDLQSAALGLLASMGLAMNGSATGNFMNMMRTRNDKDNNTFWAQHQVNQDQATNTYNDSLNQNVVARRDAMQSAEKAIRDITADWMANMNNINPELYKAQTSVGGDKSLAPSTAWNANKAKQNTAQLSGYVMPDQALRSIPARNTMRGNDYFAQLMNRFNGR